MPLLRLKIDMEIRIATGCLYVCVCVRVFGTLYNIQQESVWII